MDRPDDSRRVPAGKTRIYHAAAALGRRRMASMGKRELREHQRNAANARWAKVRKKLKEEES